MCVVPRALVHDLKEACRLRERDRETERKRNRETEIETETEREERGRERRWFVLKTARFFGYRS